MRSLIKAVCVLSVAVAGTVGLALAQTAPDEARSAANRDYRPFVKVMCDCNYEVFKIVTSNGRRSIGPSLGAERRTEGVGSGTVITADGLVLTNHHVAKAVMEERQVAIEEKDVVVKITPQRIVIAEVDPASPFGRPNPRYIAKPVGLYKQMDMAVLKIVRDLHSDAPVQRTDFAFAPLANPYRMTPGNDELTAIGYPDKGGEAITVSRGLFMGYHIEGRAPDGSLNSSVTIGPGNSGGGALFREQLVAVPTSVSTDAGSVFGYLNPVTWAMRPLAYAALRFDLDIPEIDLTWLKNQYNYDVARTRAFLGGRVTSAVSTLAVAGAQVILHRADRKLDQIIALDRELQFASLALDIKAAVEQGMSVEDVAEKLEITVADVKELLQFDDSALSADANAFARGEFFYSNDTTERDGFYFLVAPRSTKLLLNISADGYRPGSYDLNVRDYSYSSITAIKLYRP